MDANTLRERRRYVEQVKASFQADSGSSRYRDVNFRTYDMERADVGPEVGGGWKWRLLAALLLFGGFVYLSQSKAEIGGMSAAQAAEYLSQDFEAEQVSKLLPKVDGVWWEPQGDGESKANQKGDSG